MSYLIGKFQAIANGIKVLPPGVVSEEEAQKRVESARKWASDLLGNPNDLKEPFKDYVDLGETCADGIKYAHSIIVNLREEVARLRLKIQRNS